jgi:hypothetical protein
MVSSSARPTERWPLPVCALCRAASSRPTLAEGMLLAHLPDSRVRGYEVQPFFRITDYRERR